MNTFIWFYSFFLSFVFVFYQQNEHITLCVCVRTLILLKSMVATKSRIGYFKLEMTKFVKVKIQFTSSMPPISNDDYIVYNLIILCIVRGNSWLCFYCMHFLKHKNTTYRVKSVLLYGMRFMTILLHFVLHLLYVTFLAKTKYAYIAMHTRMLLNASHIHFVSIHFGSGNSSLHSNTLSWDDWIKFALKYTYTTSAERVFSPRFTSVSIKIWSRYPCQLHIQRWSQKWQIYTNTSNTLDEVVYKQSQSDEQIKCKHKHQTQVQQ